MDGAYVAVKFPGTSSNANCQSSSASDADPSSLLQDCRLLRIDELQVSIGESPAGEYWDWHLECVMDFDSKIPFVSCRLSKLVEHQKFLTVSKGLLKSFVYLKKQKY